MVKSIHKIVNQLVLDKVCRAELLKNKEIYVSNLKRIFYLCNSFNHELCNKKTNCLDIFVKNCDFIRIGVQIVCALTENDQYFKNCFYFLSRREQFNAPIDCMVMKEIARNWITTKKWEYIMLSEKLDIQLKLTFDKVHLNQLVKDYKNYFVSE